MEESKKQRPPEKFLQFDDQELAKLIELQREHVRRSELRFGMPMLKK